MDCIASQANHWKIAFFVLLVILALIGLISGYQLIHIRKAGSKNTINDIEQTQDHC